LQAAFEQGRVMEALSAERIRAGLGTLWMGQTVVYLPETSSTNDEARRLAEAGTPEGTVVVTDYQTAGRGRLSRSWAAPKGCCLLLSLVFRPEVAPHQLQRLTMICGLALATAIEEKTGLAVGLKWPNDVVFGEAKVAGILTEIGLSGRRIDYVIVGMGLNVNLDPGQLPADLAMPATSLSQVLGRPVSRVPLLQAFLRQVEARYLALQAGQSPHDEWAQRLVTVGQMVKVSSSGQEYSGVAEGVNADGALLVRLPDGRLQTVLAGDVSLRS
jgi:BirA family biotin operon repressor/biotin-[acetyl-CoA-carboxylase] ligase